MSASRASTPLSDTLERSAVLHVASLSSLSLSEAEADKMLGELRGILKHFEELAAVDTESVEPTTTPTNLASATSAWRADELQPGLAHDEALAQAPRAEHDGFAVPAFVES